MMYCRQLHKDSGRNYDFSFLTQFISSFFQIHSTMKEDSSFASESKSERFVTHVDLTQTGTLMVSIKYTTSESVANFSHTQIR